ncbi:MAG: glutamine synthetase III [Bacteroidales bacterium]|nr:glutamine synthetase III [Bacteroidales bacterium]
MSNIRFKALELAISRSRRISENKTQKISDYFGELTFSPAVMTEYLSKKSIESLEASINKGDKIDRNLADQVANALKEWAISKGATHYTHWFHPLTGATAEKHDSFLNPVGDGKAIEYFSGNELIQQEPDASSFPSGGIRNTFEARGYTAWDPTSTAFIMDDTLCIPTIFVSYTGEALDYKTPMLKALHALDKEATAVCKYFDSSVEKVIATLGWEQEYFLVDTALFHARPDMALTGRTLFGHASAKDQQLSDHYFGTIPERVMDFMKEFEYEAHRLGIPVKTRHNEVAPSQFECAPVFEETNVAVDHNQLLMHILEKVAKRHNLTILLHEKPYQGINGSGKHNNWSLQTNTGANLLSPGNTPGSNLQFLTFLVNIIKAVDQYADLLRSSIASASNDLRLGANEAPPAIMSVFIGSQLSQILNEVENSTGIAKKQPGNSIPAALNIPKIPEILLDNTDRNRTSPFAFTGNKFEFRAVGSSESCAKPMIALNLIVADQLRIFRAEVDSMLQQGRKKEESIYEVIRKYIAESRKIRFDGNSYSDDWIQEAIKRGLSNISSTPDALKVTVKPEIVSLFEHHQVLSKRELLARLDISLENYLKKVQIESRVIGDLSINHIIPTAIRYQNTLIDNVKGLKEVLDNKTFVKLSNNQMQNIKEISEHISIIRTLVHEMVESRKLANKIENLEAKAFEYNQTIIPFFETIRYHVDKLELLVDDELWPLPKYRELLFIR